MLGASTFPLEAYSEASTWKTTKPDGGSIIIYSDLQHNLDTGLSQATSHSKKASDLENILVLV